MADWVVRTHQGAPYIPLPTQLAFHQSKARFRSYIGFIGAGKSLCGSVEAFTLAVNEPGHRPGRTLICRESYPQLVKSTWNTFKGVVRETCPDLIAKETMSTYDVKIVLKNGWEFQGMNLQNYQNFGSVEADYVWIDEVNDDGVGLDAYSMLCGRIGRNIVPHGRSRVWTTGNPGGRNWLYDLFFKHKLEGGQKKADHEGFQPRADENIYLPKEYWDELRAFYTEEWIKKFLEGSFDVFEGAVLDNFDRQIHVIDEFTIPPEWPRYRGLDHGWTHPTACVWVAQDPDGNLFVYREYYKKCAVPQVNAQAILDISGKEEDQVQFTAIDPATKATETAGGSAQRIVDQYREGGLICRIGDNDVRASIALIKGLLSPQGEHLFPRYHPDRGSPGAPKLYITRGCRNLISEVMQWRWKSVRPDRPDREQVLAKNDDVIAALRYCLMEMPRAPKPVIARGRFDWLSEALNERTDGLESKRNLIGAR